MSRRWARVLSVAVAAALSASLVTAVGQTASAKEPKLSSAVYAAALPLASGSGINFHPVLRTVAITFGKTYKSRVVTLQARATSNAAAAWAKVGAATKLSSSGKATFKLAGISDSLTYRGVVDKTSSKPALATSVRSLADQWPTVLKDNFDTDDLTNGSTWTDRALGAQVGSRLCSVPSADARSITNGTFVAGMSKMSTTDPARAGVIRTANELAKQAYDTAIAKANKLKSSKARKAAKAKAAADLKAVKNCPRGVYKNSLITTTSSTVNTGTPGMVTARVKFPRSQGMHASIWLQSTKQGGAEIDFIESFGYGSGITSYVHVPSTGHMDKPGKPGVVTKKGGYVLNSKKNNKAWWDKFHDFSVEWTASSLIFRVDGSTTKTLKLKPGNADYQLVMSLLSSDWELGRLTKPIGKGIKTTDVSKQKMVVDSIRVWSKV